MKNRMELFENAPVWKAYFTISLPVVFSMVVTLVYNMVDTFFVAGLRMPGSLPAFHSAPLCSC